MDTVEKWEYVIERLNWFLEVIDGIQMYEDEDFVLLYFSIFIQKLELMFPGTIERYKSNRIAEVNIEEFKEKIY